MEESFKILCRLIREQKVTYEEAYALMKKYFSSQNVEISGGYEDWSNIPISYHTTSTFDVGTDKEQAVICD